MTHELRNVWQPVCPTFVCPDYPPCPQCPGHIISCDAEGNSVNKHTEMSRVSSTMEVTTSPSFSTYIAYCISYAAGLVTSLFLRRITACRIPLPGLPKLRGRKKKTDQEAVQNSKYENIIRPPSYNI